MWLVMVVAGLLSGVVSNDRAGHFMPSWGLLLEQSTGLHEILECPENGPTKGGLFLVNVNSAC